MTAPEGVASDPASPQRRRRGPLVAAFHHFPPFPGAGSIRAIYFAREMVRREGLGDLAVLTTVVGPLLAEPADRYRTISIGSDPIENRRSLVSRALGETFLGLRAGLAAIRLRPRLMVISSPGYIFAILVALTMRIARIPYVLDIRDLYPEVYAGVGLMRRDSRIFVLLSALSRSMYRHAKITAAATDGLVNHIREQVPEADVRVVYNGYPADMRTRGEIRKRTRFTCVFHGVLGYYQDAKSLLHLARALEPHGVDVIVIGYGRGEAVFADDPPANLTVTGRLPFEETVAIIEEAHVGLCLRTDDPISRDALPVKMFEYVALALPVLVTPPSEAGRFVERFGCGAVFEAGDIEALTAEVLRLRDDQVYYSAKISACAGIGHEFTREFQAGRFADIVAQTDVASREYTSVGPD